MKYNSITQHNDNYNIPVDAPAYGPLPTVYRGVVFNYVYFKTDSGNIASLLPDFFEPGEDGICVAFSIDVPFSSSYGPFHEMGVAVQARFKGQKIFYLPSSISTMTRGSAGREIYGSPKKLADIKFEQKRDVFYCDLHRDDIDIIQITTKILGPAKEEEFLRFSRFTI